MTITIICLELGPEAPMRKARREQSTKTRPPGSGCPLLAYGLSVIDLHCHVLAGIDDGPRTMLDSVAIARAASAVGMRTIIATPHVSRRYPNEADVIIRLVAELNERLAAEELEIEIRPGAEIAMTHAIDLSAAQLSALGIGGGPWL